MNNNRGIFLFLCLFFLHLVTCVALAIFYEQPFNFFSPFYLIKFFIVNSLGLNPISKYTKFWVWFYVLEMIIPIILDNVLHNLWVKTKYGYAKFTSSAREIKKMGLKDEEGFIFGRLKNNPIKRIITGRKFDILKSSQPLSTLIVAPTGTGKTAGFIIPSLRTIKNSVVVLDIKGELYSKTHQERARMGHQILYLDPSDFDKTLNFNPFSRNLLPTDKRFWPSYIGNVSNILFIKRGDGDKTDYFNATTKDFFNTLALYLVDKHGYTTITQVRNILSKSDNIEEALKRIREEIKEKQSENNLNQDPVTQDIFDQIQAGLNRIIQIAGAKDQFAGVVGSFNTKLAAYDDFDIKNIINCENSSITTGLLRKQKTTIYIKIKDGDLKRMSPLIVLLLETLVSSIISELPNESDNQITFILDEFANFGKVERLIASTTISRSYKLNQIFVLQDLEQLSNVYSKEEKNILESNTAYKIILKQNNFATAKAFSDLVGNKTDFRISESSNKKTTTGSGSISKSLEGVHLLTPQDFLNLEKDKCIILAQGFYATPIEANIPWYFNNN